MPTNLRKVLQVYERSSISEEKKHFDACHNTIYLFPCVIQQLGLQDTIRSTTILRVD